MAPDMFQGETQAERRRYTRKPVKLRVNYKCLNLGQVTKPSSQLAEDLGAGGLAMRTKQVLEKNQMLMLVLYLPPQERRQPSSTEVEYSEEESLGVEILGRVAWCTRMADEYLIGVQFLDLDPNNRKWLKEFLVDYQLDQPDSNLYA